MLFALYGGIPNIDAYPFDQRKEVGAVIDKIKKELSLDKGKRS